MVLSDYTVIDDPINKTIDEITEITWFQVIMFFDILFSVALACNLSPNSLEKLYYIDSLGKIDSELNLT